MKIMILTPWFWPAFNAGGPVQSLSNMIKEVNEDIEYSVLTSDRDIDLPLKDVRSDVWQFFGRGTRVLYLSPKGRSRRIIKELNAVNPDLLFITGIYSLFFTVLPLFVFKGSKIIISARGMLHPPALRKKSFKKKIYLFFFRPLTRWRKVIFHATDETEKVHILSSMGPDTKVMVASNIPSFFEPEYLVKNSGILHLITIALISPMKNHHLVLEALRNMEGEIHYHICGPVFDKAYWEKCLDIMASLPGNIKVHFHGPIVPADVPLYLAKAHVFICPSESENFGHALFEGMAAGKPIITSHNTPWNGLEDVKAGLNISPDPKSLENGIRFFLKMGEKEYLNWSKSATSHARVAVDLKKVKQQYFDLFNHN